MITFLDHLFALTLLVGLPLYAWRSWPKLKRLVAEDEPGVRPRIYWHNIVLQWVLAAAALGAWLYSGRPWGELGFGTAAKFARTPSLAGIEFAHHDHRTRLARWSRMRRNQRGCINARVSDQTSDRSSEGNSRQ